MTNGKDWMAGQNWITQFQLCCLYDGHCDLIRTIGDGHNAMVLMNNARETFIEPIICDDDRWVERAFHADDDCYHSVYNLCM